MNRSRLPVLVEILTGISIVASLILLTVEVRANTRALERQIRLDRAMAITQPVLESETVLEAYTVVKERDGREPVVEAFMREYGLSEEQAIAWTRLLTRTWMEKEADFHYMGSDDELLFGTASLLQFPDNTLFWDTAAGIFTPEFRRFVEEARRLLAPAEPGQAPSQP